MPHSSTTDAAKAICDAHNATIDKPTRPPILDEEWRYDRDDNAVYDKDGKVVYMPDFEVEMAALPDALRALVMVRDNVLEFPIRAREKAKDALKKAGIE